MELAAAKLEGWGQHAGGCGARPWPHPSDLAGDLRLWSQSCRVCSQLPFNRPLQVCGMLFSHLKGVLPMTYQVLENPPWLIEMLGWKSTNTLISQRD